VILVLPGCAKSEAPAPARTFNTADDAVKALIASAKDGNIGELMAIFGPDATALVQSSDAATARRNREVFVTAAAEEWRLSSEGPNRRILVIGREQWPFPIPIVMEGTRWRFDTAAGQEEVIDRRIGRNELAAIRVCHTYVAAQRVYAKYAHDGRSAGIFAAAFRSEPGRQDGLYWPATKGQRRSPLGDLVAQATIDSRSAAGQPAPFYGYHFKILTAQGPAAPGGAKDYINSGAMTGGFALVAWPAEYDRTGVMTFLVAQDGIVFQKDLGAGTADAARQLARYDPDATWTRVQ
jgi:hypothetical protein